MEYLRCSEIYSPVYRMNYTDEQLLGMSISDTHFCSCNFEADVDFKKK